ALLAGAGPGAGAAAQELPMAAELPLDGVESYAADVPAPEEVVGHEVGTRHTESARVADYFRAVAEASDRVVVREHARSYEDRPLLHAVVTSPENHGRLDAIRRSNLRLSESPGDVPDGEVEEMPAVVYMGYSVHGDEASGSEAAMVLLYHLAAGSGSAVDSVLRDAVVVVDPLFNPDGRDRFVDWANRNRGGVANTDPQDREHDQPWPAGRTNHYWFDLNRDWLPAQHPESQGRLEVFHRWRPQVLTDYHEMGRNATYFFQPGVPSRTNPHTPQRNQELTGEIAEFHARALDRVDQLYYTRETFDDYYYGKGSTYPDLNGGIGILFEQASSRALRTETEHGVLDYATTVRNQVATSLSTLRAAVSMRTELLRYQRDFYAEASEVAADSDVKAWVVGVEGNRTRAQELGRVLRRHRVEIRELARDVEAEGRQFRAGEAWVVPVDQPQARLVKAFMERATSFPDSIFYDVSTWTLPLAFGVEHARLRDDPSGLVGEPVTEIRPDGGDVRGGRAEYAYLMEWDRYYAPRALHRMQAAGVRARVMTEPFTARVDGEARSFGRGTVVFPLDQEAVPEGRVDEIARQAADRDHVEMWAVDSGLMPDGPDLGSAGAEVLRPPRPVLVTGGGPAGGYGEGAGAYDAGQVWHLLSERFRVPVSLLDVGDVGGADLDRYDVMVLAGGGYGGLASGPVERWVEEGGRLVVLSDGVEWAVENDLLELEERELPMDSLTEGVPYGQLSRARGAQLVGGSIFQARLDTTHPLAYGLPERLAVFREHETFYEPTGEPGRDVGVYPADEPVLSGWVSEANRRRARGAAAVVTGRRGDGRVVAVMDDPNFRAFWYGSDRLFLNALFLGGVD
ncbi:MAG: M14 family metallopeptidase, partial [Gemmatimonadota bacterium]